MATRTKKVSGDTATPARKKRVGAAKVQEAAEVIATSDAVEPAKPVAKKRAPRTKTTTAKTTTPAKTKTTAAKTGVRKAPAKTAATKVTRTAAPKEYDDEGFQVGSDSSIIATALLEGEVNREQLNIEIEKRIKKSSGLTTRNNKPKYIPSMVSSILSRMMASGQYEVHASWQLVKIEKPVRKSRKK